MQERYFPGFTFKQLQPEKPIMVGERVIFSRSLKQDAKGTQDQHQENTDPWSQRGVLQTFNRTLAILNATIVTPPLTRERKTMTFVSPEEVLPQTERDKQRLIDRYGTYIVDSIGADCKRLPNGAFLMRIGLKGEEANVEKEEVLQLMSHEYGHTLGENIEEPVFEELKAYAFSNLFMRTYHRASDYDVSTENKDETHSQALNWLEQLKVAGIREEDILAHLTGVRFGTAMPTDYRTNMRR